jgi:penicillin amidase
MRAPLLALLASVALVGPCSQRAGSVEIPGLNADVAVTTDGDGVRHLLAEDDFDLALAEGYVHCRDRLFQMDDTRRQVDGTQAELYGPGRLASDIQARIVGLHRAAQRSFDAAPPRFQALLQAYANGVNHCIDTLPLPPEYALLELTQVRPWTAVDSLAIGKGISASLSLDVDTGLTETFLDYVDAGTTHGFDGAALFSADLYRAAPMDPASTVPDATGGMPFIQASTWKPNTEMLARLRKSTRSVNEAIRASPLYAAALDRREGIIGSNEWGVSGSVSTGGRPIIANDPHLSLNMPSTFYEWHLVVADDPVNGPMNVYGVGFAGTPGVILGQNSHITWGATTNPMDVSDVFSDTLLVAQPECLGIGALACIESPPGTFHPVELELGVVYRFNVIGDGVDDNLVQAMGLPPEAQTIAWVPFRSFGPIIDVSDPSVLEPPFGITDALVLQYTGFHATRELETFSIWNRATNLTEFLDGLAKFDVGSQNWAYADVDGNLAYFTSAEMPLRTDLESGSVVGRPPFLVRDGKSGLNNWVPDPAPGPDQAIPFEILPFDEMPHTINPANGFFVNSNNDPAGTSLDNDPLNQMRIGKPSAIYYLNPGYSNGARAGRITRLIQARIDAKRKISRNDMQAFQANTQQLDAELMTPFLLEAFANATARGAPAELAALGADPEIAEAIGRLAVWDFSTPTGIPEGYDAHDNKGDRTPSVAPGEAAASVAATIYNLWRGHAIQSIIDARLASFGLDAGSNEAFKALYHLLSQSPYTGVGASGVDFIPGPPALSAEERRDLALLAALRSALDALASNQFAPAFANSTDQDEYRWGKLHRIVFDHAFDASLSVPPQNGFAHLAPDLPGVARDGGYEVVNASSFSARATELNSFMFGGGPVRRYVGRGTGGNRIEGFNVIPGGPSGIPGDPGYTTQLGTWLTADYHRVNMSLMVPRGIEETLTPPG